MIQRLPDKHDPGEAYARWEWPGGRIDGGHAAGRQDPSVFDGAVREWSEETGATLPPEAEVLGGFVSPDGAYEGFVVRIPSETDLALDPQPEETADAKWWDPADLDDPQVRDKVAEELPEVRALLKSERADFHRHTDAIVDHYTPKVAAAMAQVLEGETIEAALRAGYGVEKAATPLQPPPPKPAAIQALSGAPVVASGVGAAAGVGAIGAAAGATAIGAAAGHAVLVGAALAILASAMRRTQPLDDAIADLYDEGYVQGAQAAAEATGQPAPFESIGAFEPGTVPGRIGSDEPAPLAELLRERGIWVREITETEVNRIGEAIRQSIEHGRPLSEARAAVDAIVHDADRARMITETEYARAQTYAVRETYRRNGVAMVRWLAQPDACPMCLANKAVSPIPLGDAWPNGNVPVHPNCRCAEAPSYGGS